MEIPPKLNAKMDANQSIMEANQEDMRARWEARIDTNRKKDEKI
jgi:hypothetical protein